MISGFISVLRSSVMLLLVMTVLLGGAYPLMVMGIAQGLYPYRANGSLIAKDNRIIGSELLGQQFDNEWFFWSRPSVTRPAYNAASSGGSNLSTSNMQLQANIQNRMAMLQ